MVYEYIIDNYKMNLKIVLSVSNMLKNFIKYASFNDIET